MRTSAPAVSCELDLRAISYVDEVDENLLCPICHGALIEPVTSRCGKFMKISNSKRFALKRKRSKIRRAMRLDWLRESTPDTKSC